MLHENDSIQDAYIVAFSSFSPTTFIIAFIVFFMLMSFFLIRCCVYNRTSNGINRRFY